MNEQIEKLEQDNKALADALAKLENAVNRSVSGMKVDVGEWLKLLHEARTALGDRVIN